MSKESVASQMADVYDVVIVGGCAAGLSAAVTLGRALRSGLVIDAGEPRNAPAAGVHGFLSRGWGGLKCSGMGARSFRELRWLHVPRAPAIDSASR
ncbi:hypothetical protein ACX80S_18460 [Arthrobacter sp. RHLT1-20]